MFRINSRETGVYHVPLALQCIYMDAVMKEVKIGMGRRGMRFQEKGREWRLPSFLYADDLVFCSELEEDLRAMVGCFDEVCRRRCLKVNAGKSKLMELGGEGLEYEVCVDWIFLENVSEFKYLGCVLDKSGTDEAECSWKVASGRREAAAIRSLVNARNLQLEFARVLHETLLVPILTCSSEIMIWREKERSRIRTVQMDNLAQMEQNAVGR